MYRLNPQKLRQYRLARGITLNQAAQAAGYKNAATMLYIERGAFRIPVDRLLALAQFYGVKIEDLCDDEEPASAQTG